MTKRLIYRPWEDGRVTNYSWGKMNGRIWRNVMAISLFDGKNPFVDFITRGSGESFTMMSGGLDMFNKISHTRLELVQSPHSATPPAPVAFQNFSNDWLEGYSRMYRIWMEST